MKVTRDNSSPIEVTLSVELATEDEDPFIQRSYRRVVSRLNIPGFRRGRAPRHIVESMMGRTALLQEALEFMVRRPWTRSCRTKRFRRSVSPASR